jgi:hypothetical protein
VELAQTGAGGVVQMTPTHVGATLACPSMTNTAWLLLSVTVTIKG